MPRTAPVNDDVLVLVPGMSDMSRADIEQHMEVVRARRMVAAITYFEGKNAKLGRQSEVLQRRLTQQYEMLGKEIDALDRALAKMQKRLEMITTLEERDSLVQDQIVILGADDAAGDDNA